MSNIKEKIYFWPQWLEESITNTPAKTNLDFARTELNLWRALNIYDDILDDNKNKHLLPDANIYFKNFIKFFYQLSLPTFFLSLLDNTIEEVERANQLETTYQRLKIVDNKIIIPQKLQLFITPEQLSKKSLTLTLAPLALLLDKQYINTKQEALNFFSFLQNILAIKQLADDIYDWQEDLRKGHLTFVVNLLLEELRKTNKVLDLNNQLLIEKSFIKIIPQANAKLLLLCKQIEEKAKKLKLKRNCRILKETILPIEQSALKALHFQKLLNIN